MPTSSEHPSVDTWVEPAVSASRGRRLVALSVGQFAVAGLIALAIVGLATSIASRRIGEREAITDARTTTVLKAQGVVEPAMTDALLTGDKAAIARLATIVRRDVLDHSLVRVKIWTPDGRIVFSDEPQLIGTQYRLGKDERDAIVSRKIEAEVSDLSKPENVFERPYGKLLEVYLPIRTPSGKPVLFESYSLFRTVDVNGARLWRAFAPIALGALVMLELVQIPLAWSLARRLRNRLREREALLGRVVQASEVERRQIASDLHDGAVQDLAGVAFELSAAAREPSGSAEPATLERSAETIRGSIQSLRSLIVDIYPPNFDETSFESALTDLVARARDRGLETALDHERLRDPVPNPVARLLYRAAQEGVRNVLSHAGASEMRIRVSTDDGIAALEITDDGRGLGEDGPREGHMGLTTLRGLVMDAGGSLDLGSRDPSGVRLRVEIPL